MEGSPLLFWVHVTCTSLMKGDTMQFILRLISKASLTVHLWAHRRVRVGTECKCTQDQSCNKCYW